MQLSVVLDGEYWREQEEEEQERKRRHCVQNILSTLSASKVQF